MLLASVIAGLLLLGMIAMPSPASAKTRSCGMVVKKLGYSGFYKAKVVVVHGKVPCREARRVIWKAIKGGGFNGRVNGWDCQAKGHSDPYREKCLRENPRRVIQSSRPRRCHSCHGNRKRPALRELARKKGKSWKRCGLIHYVEKRYLIVEAKLVGCHKARQIGRASLRAPGKGHCIHRRCDVRDYRCHLLGKPKVATLCTKKKQRIKLRFRPSDLPKKEQH